MSLKEILEWKKTMGREKDKKDIEIIRKRIEGGVNFPKKTIILQPN